jgi:hypothetical protein
MSAERENHLSSFTAISRLLKNARYFDLDVYDTAKDLSKSEDLSEKEKKKLIERISTYKRLPPPPMSSNSSSSSSSSDSEFSGNSGFRNKRPNSSSSSIDHKRQRLTLEDDSEEIEIFNFPTSSNQVKTLETPVLAQSLSQEDNDFDDILHEVFYFYYTICVSP